MKQTLSPEGKELEKIARLETSTKHSGEIVAICETSEEVLQRACEGDS